MDPPGPTSSQPCLIRPQQPCIRSHSRRQEPAFLGVQGLWAAQKGPESHPLPCRVTTHATQLRTDLSQESGLSRGFWLLSSCKPTPGGLTGDLESKAMHSATQTPMPGAGGAGGSCLREAGILPTSSLFLQQPCKVAAPVGTWTHSTTTMNPFATGA
nr:sodium/potassium-transporting ATPase subunit gamma isoform X2 [Vicugna pacos]